MLSFFRNGGIGNVIVAGIAFTIIVVFALEFRAGRSGPTAKLTRECAVAYAGYCADAKEYYAAQGVLVPRQVTAKQSKRFALRKKVLDGLVERELLVAEAEKLGLRVSEEDLNEDLIRGRVRASLPSDAPEDLVAWLGLCTPERSGYGCQAGTEYPVRQLQVQRTDGEPFDYKLYERQVRMLANRGPKEFKEMQARELLAARMREIVRSRVRIPDSEAFAIYQRERTKAVVRSVNLKRDWFAKYAVEVNDAAVDKWSLSNQAQVDADWATRKADFAEGCSSVREIFVELPSMALDDEKPAVKLKAEQARERVVKGEAFDAVAREVSQGQSAMLGGELGCIGSSYGIGADELKKALEGLKPGDLSPVVESPRGYHVLKVVEKITADKLEHAGRRFSARRLFVRFAADEALASFAEQLLTRAKGGEKLEEATRALSVDFAAKLAPKAPKKDGADSPALLAADRPHFEVSAPFNASGNPLPDVQATEPLTAKAFELKKPDELYSKPLPTLTGALVLQLKDLTQASRDEFAKDKFKLLQSLLKSKANEAVARYVHDLRRAAGDKLKVMSEFGEEAKGRSDEEE
jgi:peptidyl-prolyl cis-trans isomerase D